MSEIYRIHFGYSQKSKYYPQAIQLAEYASHHEILGEGEDTWHIVTLTEDQIDLMATLYVIATKIPLPKIYGVDIQYTYVFCLSGGAYNYVHVSESLKKKVLIAVERLQGETGKSIFGLANHLREKYLIPIERDMSKIREKLKRESRIDYIDPNTQTWVKAKNKPKEPIDEYKKIRELVTIGKYSDAIDIYYASLKKQHYGEFSSELFYLKRLANIPITGRDLLYFRKQSSRKGLIGLNLSEYVECIDNILLHLKDTGRKTPLDLLLEYAPTMEQIIENRNRDWHLGVYLWDGELKRDTTNVTMNSFSPFYDACQKGRFFDQYPDQVRLCRIIEPKKDPKYAGLWVTYSPTYYQTEILDKGLHLNGIEAYRHKSWKEFRGKWRKEPNFVTVHSLDEVSKGNYATRGIEYTGQTHKINEIIFYEINLLRNIDGEDVIGNPFLELVEEILRESENLLREKHGLPHIGEGWVSETQLYRLVQAFFPDALQHASPPWLRPQHFDVFVPSKKLAFEYQGIQHFESIDFFGGQESLENTIRRDKLKMQKCKLNNVILINGYIPKR